MDSSDDEVRSRSRSRKDGKNSAKNKKAKTKSKPRVKDRNASSHENQNLKCQVSALKRENKKLAITQEQLIAALKSEQELTSRTVALLEKQQEFDQQQAEVRNSHDDQQEQRIDRLLAIVEKQERQQQQQQYLSGLYRYGIGLLTLLHEMPSGSLLPSQTTMIQTLTQLLSTLQMNNMQHELPLSTSGQESAQQLLMQVIAALESYKEHLSLSTLSNQNSADQLTQLMAFLHPTPPSAMDINSIIKILPHVVSTIQNVHRQYYYHHQQQQQQQQQQQPEIQSQTSLIDYGVWILNIALPVIRFIMTIKQLFLF